MSKSLTVGVVREESGEAQRVIVAPGEGGALGATVLADGDGLTIRAPGAPTARVPWDRLADVLLSGGLDPCRWGVLVDGEVRHVFPNRKAAQDYATDCRGAGEVASVVRLPD